MLLLTSFQTWLPHQKSNSSDDLLQEIAKLNLQKYPLTFLRQLPVDTSQASKLVIEKIQSLQPEGIICCGMAESRTLLTVESHACLGETRLDTTVDLTKLTNPLQCTEISHDAGKFVCEGLYYEVLTYLQRKKLKSKCIFVHVPVINEDNLDGIMEDFLLILAEMALKKANS